MSFVLIEFDDKDAGSVAVVHQNWLTPRKKEVFWPPYKTQGLYDKALKKGENCREDWQLFKVKRIFRYYESFEEAQAKAKVAEVTSDLQSEVDEVNLGNKRQRVKPRRFIYSDTESEEDSSLPRPPKICKAVQDISCSQAPHTPVSSVNIERNKSNTEFQSTVQDISSHITRSSTGSCSISDVTLCNAGTSYCDTPVSSVNVERNENNAEFQSNFQTKLVSYLALIVEQNKEILSLLKNRPVIEQSSVLEPNVPVTLPIYTFEDLQILENFLSENEVNCISLSKYLGSLDKNSVVSATNSALRCCLSHKLAKNMSFLGSRNNKKAFNNNILKKVIVDSVKLAIPGSTTRNIEDCIKTWLKRAPKHYKLEQIKLNKTEDAI
ncbi:uncharacterized protein LOC126881809 isoform X2 [Diabrotica virgifera virgifera]|uniref:Uncharacterized protein LOC114346282 isoform X1 n=1 Tax=Diabrotica virgifera virgifera TaxID=50390 RepID=A0A6P7H2W1_DIAVI|nr:uncharacterized protein LOC126881809 isoform X2 [Diabrotica virgifera virgifera]